jgi:hypothetical protein
LQYQRALETEAIKNKQQGPAPSSEVAGSNVTNGNQEEIILSLIQYVQLLKEEKL